MCAMKKAGILSILFLVVLFAVGVIAEAQQPTNVPRIGILVAASASSYTARLEAFRQGLRELGYVEGKNILIEYRYSEGKLQLLPDLAAELVRLKVDVIVVTAQAVLAAKKASPTIPIVFGAASDPVGSGFVSSLARPSGNITGLSVMSPELDGKRLELLKEAFPKVSRVAFLWQSSSDSRGTRLSQPWSRRPRRWDSNFYRLKCEVLMILKAHLRERNGKAPRRSLRPQVHFSLLSNAECWSSRQRTGCRRCTQGVSL
jgi:ABC-type uncharacterized transport system substrate-binding protein